MTRRIIAIAIVVASVVSAGSAEAKVRKLPPPACNLVIDPAGDEHLGSGSGANLPGDPSLDVVSADVASDGVTLTTVIRLKKLVSSSSDSNAPTGRKWNLGFYVGSTVFGTGALVDGPFGFELDGDRAPTGFKATEDLTNSEIRLSMPLQAVNDSGHQLRLGAVISAISVTTERVVQVPPSSHLLAVDTGTFSQDDAASSSPKTSYAIGQRSCLKVGS